MRKLFGPAATSERFNTIPVDLFLRPRALRASAEEAALLLPSAAALVARYNELKLPVLVVAGDGDRIINPRHHSRRLSELLPNCRLLVLPGVGHMVHHMDSRKICKAMLGTEGVLSVAA